MKDIAINVLAAIGVILTISKLFKDAFGIDAVGRRMIRFIPVFGKWLMKESIERKTQSQKIDRILSELEYNGGGSLKDMVRALQRNMDTQIATTHMIQDAVNLNTLRLDIIDNVSYRMVFKLDREGSCFYVNDAFLKEFGYTDNDVEGFNWESIIHPDDREDVKKKWQRAIEKKSRYVNVQRIVTSDGITILCKVVGYPVIESGNLKEFYGTVDEISRPEPKN